MTRPKGSVNRPKLMYRCEECGESGFITKKCPGCGSLQTLELNKDGIPINEIQNAIGAQPPMQVLLNAAPDYMDTAAELRKVATDEKIQTIDEMTLDKMKARAAEAKADRIRAEAVLTQTEEGFKAATDQDERQNPMMPQQPQPMGMDPAALLSGLGNWTNDARQDFFDRLTQDNDFALRLSQAINSQPQQQMNQQQMGNPWMNPMMMQPPQMPPEPQESAASMMTAVIGAVAQLKELSGGDGEGESAMVERLMDRMERLDERQAERDAAMQQKLMEMQQSQGNNQISPQDVQQMIHATIANSSTDQLGETIKSINGVVTGLAELGVVRRADEDKANTKGDFEQMKWKDEMDFKREDRTREDTKEERDAHLQLAKQATTKDMFSMMLDMSREANDSPKDDDKKEDDRPLPPAVARAVVA